MELELSYHDSNTILFGKFFIFQGLQLVPPARSCFQHICWPGLRCPASGATLQEHGLIPRMAGTAAALLSSRIRCILHCAERAWHQGFAVFYRFLTKFPALNLVTLNALVGGGSFGVASRLASVATLVLKLVGFHTHPTACCWSSAGNLFVFSCSCSRELHSFPVSGKPGRPK